MQRKDRIDTFGAAALIGISLILGLNQVVIKGVNEGLQPVFAAGVRSAGAMVLVYLWMRLRGTRPHVLPGTARAGILSGFLFAAEFIFIYLALDLTAVARSSVIFYSMPVWLALGAHVLIPGDRITPRKALGLVLALGGVALALFDRPAHGEASLTGDLMALAAAMCWAGLPLIVRASPLRDVTPVMQLFWQVAVSTVVLLAAAPLFGPLIRDFAPIHALGIAYQVVVVATGTYLVWFWLLKLYPASGVASFSFLSPVAGVAFGWLILGETVGPTLLGALVLVAAGIVLINRPARAA